MVLEKPGQLHEKNEVRSFFNTMPKNKLKMLKNLNVRLDTIILLAENIGRTLSDINHSNIFFNLSPRILEIKTNVNNGTYLNSKKFFHSKGNSKQNKTIAH